MFHLSVSWEPDAVPELLVPRAESLPAPGAPPTCSTMGERQESFRRREPAARPGGGPASHSGHTQGCITYIQTSSDVRLSYNFLRGPFILYFKNILGSSHKIFTDKQY